MKKKIGVVLSGCGVFDGAEIHEAVLTLLAIDRAGAEAVCMAPDIPQHHVINHLTGKPVEESRNVLVESARIARGNIEDLAGMTSEDIDALILPGGFGAAKNLSSFAFEGADAEVNDDLRRLLREVHAAGKPIGLICISPAVGACVFGELGVDLTIGNDPGTAAAIEKTGAHHIACSVRETVEDEAHRIVSTPAYMLGRSISEVADGIEALVRTVIEWTQ